MLFKSLKQQRSCIIIKDHVIRYVHSKKPSLHDINFYAERFLPEGIVREGQIIDKETFLTILDECIDNWKLRKREIQFCVPDSSVVIRNVNIPVTIEKKKLCGHLFMEIGESIHLPFEDPVYDYKVIGEDEENYEILIIAGREKVVNEMQQVLERLKLKPNAADVFPLAIYRLLYELNKVKEDEHILVVQNDISTINLTAFHKHVPLFSRNFQSTLDKEKLVLSDVNGVDRLIWNGGIDEIDNQAESLAREIERVINFYRFSYQKGKAGISKVLLLGDHPELERIISYCKENIEVTVDDILNVEIPGGEGTFPHYYYYDVMGLMLKKEVH